MALIFFLLPFVADDVIMSERDDDDNLQHQLAKAMQAQRLAETELIKYKGDGFYFSCFLDGNWKVLPEILPA